MASQKPGVAYRAPLIEGAPGHGEGHNSGNAVNIAAALAVKQIMEREKLPGTLVLWPGVAEELLATKAWYVREGLFKDVDVCLFAHVSDNLAVSWGQGGGTGLVSVEYTFTGESAHSAGAPWRGRSALDAVELMNIGWNYHREHMRLQQRSHYVVTDGGHQPNVVPPIATVWYYFRETSYPQIKAMWDAGDKMAEGAALMTNTKWTSRILGAAWPQHMNKPDRRDGVREHPEGRTAPLDGGGPAVRQGGPEGNRLIRTGRPGDRARTAGRRRSPRPISVAAVRTTSATCRGPCPRSRCAIPPTSPVCPVTTG